MIEEPPVDAVPERPIAEYDLKYRDVFWADRDYEDRYEDWQGRAQRTRPCREYGDRTTQRYFMDSLPLVDELRTRYADGVKVRVIMPCDRGVLLNSPELPPSIYSPSDELFTDTDLDQLREDVGAS